MELRFWLALIRCPGFGPARFKAVLDAGIAPESLFLESRGALSALGFKQPTVDYIQEPDWPQIENDLNWLSRSGHHAITLHDPSYPTLLKQIAVPPAVLFCIGNPSLLTSPQLAIVGSRNPSALGKTMARDFAKSLCEAGLTITSGLALGIDASAHQAGLRCGGKTIAVAGTGLDRVYPARHRQLAAEISESGCLVSEFPLDTAPRAANFPRRNRIISGLSLGVLVVEAAVRSGSLISARFALEQGREVFAIPGSIQNPLARGCNALIKNGAQLVESPGEILDQLHGMQATDQPDLFSEEIEQASAPAEQNILKYVAYSPTSIDTLVKETGESVEQIASSLLVLELQGYVQLTSGGCYCRIR